MKKLNIIRKINSAIHGGQGNLANNKEPRYSTPGLVAVQWKYIAAELESKCHLMRQEIVVINADGTIGPLKGIARPEVAKAYHV